MNDYMTTKEAAEKWGISQRQVQNHCKLGRIPGVKIVGKNYLLPVDAERPMYGFFLTSSAETQNRLRKNLVDQK